MSDYRDNGWYKITWDDGSFIFRESKDGQWVCPTHNPPYDKAVSIERVYILTHDEWNQRYVDGWVDGKSDAKGEVA